MLRVLQRLQSWGYSVLHDTTTTSGGCAGSMVADFARYEMIQDF
jgi:hypothetical protein